MCSKPTTRTSPRNHSIIRKTKPKPPRKTRTRTRKHKYISLQKDLSPSTPNSPESNQSAHQLDLFPLHPETHQLFEEKEYNNNNNVSVSYLFETNTNSTTLNGLVWSGEGCAVSSEEDSLCPSLTYAYSEGGKTSSLERLALRGNKERDLSEEKWVCYEEVTSCVPREYCQKVKMEGGLLKLDYDEIMNAWSDKGPLYIDGAGGDGVQIVPDVLHFDDLRRQNCSHLFSDMGNVPMLKVTTDGNDTKETNDGEASKLGSREASVLRYKEKRRNRLFSKRIRYEVRKLNAEKRPRMKGRFVKRS